MVGATYRGWPQPTITIRSWRRLVAVGADPDRRGVRASLFVNDVDGSFGECHTVELDGRGRRPRAASVRSQILQNGAPTVWCAQHDPLTLAEHAEDRPLQRARSQQHLGAVEIVDDDPRTGEGVVDLDDSLQRSTLLDLACPDAGSTDPGPPGIGSVRDSNLLNIG